MKKHNKIKIFLSTCLVALATVFCGVLVSDAPVKADAAASGTIASTVYQTDGASVRVFKKTFDSNGNAIYGETDKAGIRFHVETGADYKIAVDTPLLDTTDATRNKNGSYKMAEGYKSYTLVLPKRLLGGSADLNADTAKVERIDTTEYWFSDSDGNWESVAYIYNIPEAWYTDTLVYRGVIYSVDENGTETPVKWTDMEERSLTWVAKQAYNDTIDANTNYWGTEANDNTAAPLIKKFIPTYNVTYTNGQTEEVLWGDNLTKANAESTYYDETNHEPVDVTKPLTFDKSCNIKLESTTEATFVFTGVQYNANGFEVYATLPTAGFENGTPLEPSAVDMKTDKGVAVKAKTVSVKVEGTGNDAKSSLVIAFDYADISNGTKLTILDTSNFYYKGKLYELEKDYEFVYNNKNWELPLGQITMSDFKSIVNYKEGSGENEEHNIRITFNGDFLVNGDAKLTGNVYITRKANAEKGITEGRKDTIADGYYYWNQGSVKILEIPGDSGDKWGETDGDVLTIEAGARLVQNNGYYVFQETITATYDGVSNWGFTYTEHEIDASAFVSVATRSEGDKIYIDVTTAEAWADKHVKIACNDGTLTYHQADNVTKVDPNEIFYHGENGNKLLRIYLDEFSVTGDWVTIPAGTAFWVGSNIYKLTEDITSYFVDTGANNGMTWVTNPTIKDVAKVNISSMGWYQSNIRYTTDVSWSEAAFNKVVVDDTYIEEEGVVVTGSNYKGFFYYGGSNNLLELQGVDFSETGGSVTIKAGVIFWLFNNSNSAYTAAYRLTEDITIEISGATGSQMYKDVEVATVSKSDIASVTNDGSHGGEIRFSLNSKLITEMYGVAKVEGSATLNGEATPSAFVYAYLSTSEQPYTGNTIIAFTGTGFGKPFQASAVGEKVSIAAGTKVWLSNAAGYITIADDWTYVYKGNNTYVDATTEYTVTFSGENATVKVGGETVTSKAVKIGEKVTFSVEVPENYTLQSVSGAGVTDNGDGTYTTTTLFENVTVNIVVLDPVTVTFSGENATVKVDGVQVTSKSIKTGGSVTFTIETPTGYQVASVKNATLVSGTTYTPGNISQNVEVVIAVAEPIIINQNSILKVEAYSKDSVEYRIHLQQTEEINKITGHNGNIAFNGEIELKIGGEVTQPTHYNYYGLIGTANHQILGIGCDVTKMQSGDYLTIKDGSTFKFGSTILLVSGDISTKVIGVTANFDETVCSLSIDGTQLENGKTIAKIVGTSSNIYFGWKKLDPNNTAADAPTYITQYSFVSFKVTTDGVTTDLGTSGTYEDIILNGDVVIDVTTVKKPTITLGSGNYTIEGVSAGVIDYNTEVSFTVTTSTGYKVTSVTANGQTLTANNGTYTYTVTGDVTITASVTVMDDDEKQEAIATEILANASKYLTGLTISEDGKTITSTTTTSTVAFTADFFALIKEYGYNNVSFTIKTSNPDATVVQGTNAGTSNSKVVTTATINSATSYTARTNAWFLGASKANVTWTLSGVEFS